MTSSNGREPAPVTVREQPAPVWSLRFEIERGRIGSALGTTAVAVEHIGSTAVPGLAGQPVVDVLVTVQDADDESAYRPALEAVGYLLHRAEPQHRLFRTRARDVHVHVRRVGDAAALDALALRDRLRSDPEDRAWYERTSKALAAQAWTDLDGYAAAKTAVVADILARSCSRADADGPL